MENSLVQQILHAYKVEWRQILPSQKGYRNVSTPVVLENGKILNLILYKRESGILSKIKEANRIADGLALRGFPARQTYSSKIILLKTSDGSKQQYGALYTYLPGATIPWEAYTRSHIRMLGKTMGEMHILLETEATTTDCVGEYEAIVSRMRRYFADKNVRNAMINKLHCQLSAMTLQRCERALQASRQLPRQSLHMDFVRGNILFSSERKPHISGVIDFEKVGNGPRTFDIARTLAFLLVDCKYKSEKDVRKAFLESGYLKRTSFKTIRYGDFDLLEELLDMFLLYDFYKFLRHNPYEFLAQNEHFIRTRNLLQKRQHLMDMKQEQLDV